MTDKIKQGFNQIADRYDVGRKSLIPCYDDFYGVMTELAESSKLNPSIADLGAGTGLLSAMLSKKFPTAEFTLVDLSANMLNIAGQRFTGMKNFTFIEADYASFNFSGTYDLVVSSLSIHHLEDADKWKLYKKIFEMLNPGGKFINGDLINSDSDTINSKYMSHWLNKIDCSGLGDEEIKAARYRMTFDKPATVSQNLYNMSEAGFVDVDMVYKYFNFGVMNGFKPKIASL